MYCWRLRGVRSNQSNPLATGLFTGAELLDVSETRGSSRSAMGHQATGDGRKQRSVVIVGRRRNGPLLSIGDYCSSSSYCYAQEMWLFYKM